MANILRDIIAVFNLSSDPQNAEHELLLHAAHLTALSVALSNHLVVLSSLDKI